MKIQHNNFYLNADRSPSTIKEMTLQKVAKDFEALFIQMMVKSMRQTELADDIMGSRETKFFQQQLDNQMAGSLSKKTNLGIAELLVKQLQANRPMS